MIQITRKLEFDAGHRVVGHEGKCSSLHGHRYTVEATVYAEELDALGMVVDFGSIKEKLGGWLDEHWDHGMILWEEDHIAHTWHHTHEGHKMYAMPANPTAENMAEYLAKVVWPILDIPGELRRLVVRETPNCWAEWVAS